VSNSFYLTDDTDNLTVDIIYAFLALAATGIAIMLFIAVGHILREPRHKAAWAQISGLIGGIYSSRIGAMYYRYQVSGNYQGRPVDVFIETHSTEDEPNFYTYHLRIKAGTRGHDWMLRFGDTEIPSLGRKWYFESRDGELERRLTEAVDVELLEKDSAGNPNVQYRADKQALEYERFVDGDTSVPTPDKFKEQFNLLTHLAELNEKLNV
jgi:hypothetical protein